MLSVRHALAETICLTLITSLSYTPVIARGQSEIVARRGSAGASDRDAIAAAVALLPKQSVRIAVIDVTECRPPVRDHLLTLDAFTISGNTAIYIVQQSHLLQGARAGSLLYRAMLAAVLWHEMAHLAGADERRARLAEEKLWTQFLRDGLADPVTGLRYLRALKARPDDELSGMTVSSLANALKATDAVAVDSR